MKLWIARQQDNSVYLFTHKPTLFCGRWCRNGVKHLLKTLKAPEIKGDVDKYEIRYSGITKCGQEYTF